MIYPLLTIMTGEIDVIEAVEQGNDGAQSTLHTSDGCKMTGKRKEYGSVSGTDCYNGTDYNAGCGIKGGNDTYGEALNSEGGGVSATILASFGP